MNTQALLEAHAAASDNTSPRQVWVQPYQRPESSEAHQFVLFLKPEATDTRGGVRLDRVLDLVGECLDTFGVNPRAARALPAAYLADHSIMDQHYGVINRISKTGESALTEEAAQNLKKEFAEDLAAGARVLGGHQFLEAVPDFSALALTTLNDNLGTRKLGGGSYAMRLHVLGNRYILLNPFHAYQLVPFTTPGRAILVLECVSNRDWSDLRGKLTGATDPAKAAEGSIRQRLLANKKYFGMKEVNQGNNGIHLSAGPLEGMVEVRRFFTDHERGGNLAWEDTAFGSALLAKGLDEARVSELATNPVITWNGSSGSAFDLTEERNATDALERLA